MNHSLERGSRRAARCRPCAPCWPRNDGSEREAGDGHRDRGRRSRRRGRASRPRGRRCASQAPRRRASATPRASAAARSRGARLLSSHAPARRRRLSRAARRSPRAPRGTPKTMAIAAPIDEISSGSMISPTRSDDDADREADRPQGRRPADAPARRSDSCSVVGPGCSRLRPIELLPERAGPCAGTLTEPVLGPAARRRASLISGLISISSGHGRAPSSGHFAVASMPSLPPKNWRSGAWSRWSSGPSETITSRFGSTFAPA